MVQFAFSSLAFFDRTIREVAEFAAKTGYDGVELRCKEDGHINEEMSLAQMREIRQVFEDQGVKVFSVSGYTKFTSSDVKIREKNLDSLCRQIELAHELGAPFVRSLGGKVPSDEWEQNSSTYVEMLGSYLRKAAERTEGREVDVLLSTHDNFSPAEVASEVIKIADHPRVALLWCVIHPIQFGEDIATTWQHIQGKFRLVHFKDATRGDLYQWWTLQRLGDGDLPLPVVARLISEANYNGPVSIEWEKHAHPEIEDSEAVLDHGIIYLRELFQE